MRMGNTRIQHLLNGKLHGGRYVGRPQLSWEDIRIDLSLLLDIKEWRRHREGRNNWGRAIEDTRDGYGLSSN